MATVSPTSTQPLGFVERINYIIQQAQVRGLDPAAVLAVANAEGLGGKAGDNNTSFGPFQLHIGGRYPASAPQDPKDAESWANSPAGINYALSGIQGVAQGTTGQQAITNIVTLFEQPLNPGAEISRASSQYSNWQTNIVGGKFAFTTQTDTGLGLSPSSGGISSSSGAGIGDVVKAGGSVVSGAESTGKFLANITNVNFLFRAGEVIAGGVLALTGLYLLAKQIGLPTPTPPSPIKAASQSTDASDNELSDAFAQGQRQGQINSAKKAGRQASGATVSGPEGVGFENYDPVRRNTEPVDNDIPF